MPLVIGIKIISEYKTVLIQSALVQGKDAGSWSCRNNYLRLAFSATLFPLSRVGMVNQLEERNRFLVGVFVVNVIVSDRDRYAMGSPYEISIILRRFRYRGIYEDTREKDNNRDRRYRNQYSSREISISRVWSWKKRERDLLVFDFL